MHIVDAIVVGGGPAGSTCAWKLRKAGLDVVVLDRAGFPRTKLCAGWITPRVLKDLELDPGDYPHSFMTFETLTLHWKLFTARIKSRQHSIRRYEFDNYLLRRSGANVKTHKVHEIRRENGNFIVDDEFRGKYLVGAGGTSCPVYRKIFRSQYPRRKRLQAATLELEFACDWQDPACHLWFFDDGLPGYAWYVPKANGHLNVGLGAMAMQLKQRGTNLQAHWNKFTERLKKRGLVVCDDLHPKGYSYFLNGGDGSACDGNAYLVGDAIGLATRDMCEGIGPAVESALLAARSIVNGSEYSLSGIASLSGQSVVSRRLERKFTGYR